MAKKNKETTADDPGGGEGTPGPIRTCIGCRTRRAQIDLVRVWVGETGEPVAGDRGPGRGAWLCADPGCVEAAAKSRAFSRAFRSGLADRNFADTLLGWLSARDQ